jgi:putative ABC transport system substrate-binding protein
MTGLSHLAGRELSAKRPELLKEAVPKISRVAVVWDAPLSPEGIASELQPGARRLGVTLQSLQVQTSRDIEDAFRAMTRHRANGLSVYEVTATTSHLGLITDLAAKHRLLAMYGSRLFADGGGLMSYSARFPDLFRRAAAYVDKILKGINPAELPAEQPTRFELVINLKTAKALGLTIPQSILIRRTT